MSAFAYWILQHSILSQDGCDSVLARAIGADRKGKASLLLYASAIGLAFLHPAIAWSLYLLVAILWLVPDRRIERALREQEGPDIRHGRGKKPGGIPTGLTG